MSSSAACDSRAKPPRRRCARGGRRVHGEERHCRLTQCADRRLRRRRRRPRQLGQHLGHRKSRRPLHPEQDKRRRVAPRPPRRKQDRQAPDRSQLLWSAQPVKGNGGEQIQIGLKEQQFSDSNSIVEYNLFEECDGEIELISVKSGGNHIRYNTPVRDRVLHHLAARQRQQSRGQLHHRRAESRTPAASASTARSTRSPRTSSPAPKARRPGRRDHLHSGDDSDPARLPGQRRRRAGLHGRGQHAAGQPHRHRVGQRQARGRRKIIW